MTREFDPRKSYLAVKANEKMIAYVGFVIQLEESGKTKEGVVKISSFHRPYGGGYLTLTFIIDKGGDEKIEDRLESLSAPITENALMPMLGKDFEKLVKVDLDALEAAKGWYIEEINVYFRKIKDREKVLVEEQLLPALESILPCKFEIVEWWPEGRSVGSPDSPEIEAQDTLRGLFKKWFRAGSE